MFARMLNRPPSSVQCYESHVGGGFGVRGELYPEDVLVVVAATLFAVALIACGLNSTVTATLTGQIVMEGFVRLRMKPATRRLITRCIAIAPAIGVTLYAGESATAQLLVLSQVALSVTLPFAVVPLVAFTAQRSVMGELVAPRRTTALAAIIAAVIIALNLKLLWDAAG